MCSLYRKIVLLALFLFVSATCVLAQTSTAPVMRPPKELSHKELLKALDCMINRIAIAGRVDGIVHDKEWAQTRGMLRVKYRTFYDPGWDGYNLWVLVLHKKSNYRGFMVLYKWDRKKCQSFAIGNDSEVVKDKGEWIARAVLWGFAEQQEFEEAARRMEKMPAIEVPVKDVTTSCARCSYLDMQENP